MSEGLDAQELRTMYHGWELTQDEIADVFGVSQKSVWGAMKRYGISARKAVKRNQWGARNHMWKGDGASYAAFHFRLEKRYGKPKECSVCGTSDPGRSYDWANLTGDYANMDDYRRMCRSCHWKYDGTIRNLKGGVPE